MRADFAFASYGPMLWRLGSPYGCFVETADAIAGRSPALQGKTPLSRDHVSQWLDQQPFGHHLALPGVCSNAMVGLARLWGWPRVAALLVAGCAATSIGVFGGRAQGLVPPLRHLRDRELRCVHHPVPEDAPDLSAHAKLLGSALRRDRVARVLRAPPAGFADDVPCQVQVAWLCAGPSGGLAAQGWPTPRTCLSERQRRHGLVPRHGRLESCSDSGPMAEPPHHADLYAGARGDELLRISAGPMRSRRSCPWPPGRGRWLTSPCSGTRKPPRRGVGRCDSWPLRSSLRKLDDGRLGRWDFAPGLEAKPEGPLRPGRKASQPARLGEASGGAMPHGRHSRRPRGRRRAAHGKRAMVGFAT